VDKYTKERAMEEDYFSKIFINYFSLGEDSKVGYGKITYLLK